MPQRTRRSRTAPTSLRQNRRRRKAGAATRRRRARIELLERRYVLAAPTLAPLANVTLTSGAPLHIALDGADADADGNPLTYEVRSNNPVVTASVISGDRSLRMAVNGFGTMEFYLFEDEAAGVTSRIVQLAQQGFYNGLNFHRIIPGFVIQGGDPAGNGTGGSGVEFDDQFDPDLRHTGVGMLSMAKSLDDTNDSQFFITAPSTANLRNLDFNHSVFGFLTNGESVRSAINNVGTPGGTPQTPVTIGSVTVFSDTENGVLRLSAPEGSAGTINITVTVRDSTGQSSEQTFQVTVLPDNRNDTPFLEPIQALATATNIPLTFTLSARDVEANFPGGAVQFGAVADPAKVNVQFSNNGAITPDASGLAQVTVTLTPLNGFIGNTAITFYAHDPSQPVPANPVADSVFNGAADLQTQSLTVTEAAAPSAPTGLDLLAGSDTGTSSSDDLTALNNTSGKQLAFQVSGLIPGAQVILRAGNIVIADTIASSATMTITTNGTATIPDGAQSITATQTIGGFTSEPSAPLAIRMDTSPPIITSEPAPSTLAGLPYGYDATSIEEGQPGMFYRVLTSPPGFAIGETTGVVDWTPDHTQLGDQVVVIRATDLAGNFADQEFVVNVINLPPELADIADQVVDEESQLELPITASDANLPGDTLQFTLLDGAPAGLSIDPATGVLRWTPSEIQGPGTFNVGVQVTDAGGLSDTKTFTIDVQEVNRSPVIQAVPNQLVLPGDELELQIVAADPDVPARAIVFSLLQGPEGASIDPVTGVFRFAAPEDQSLLSVTVTVLVSEVGSNPLSSTMTFNLSTFDPGLGLFITSNLRSTVELPESMNQRVANFTSNSAGLSLLFGRSLPAIGSPSIPGQAFFDRYEGGAPNFLFIGPDTGVPQIGNEILDGQQPAEQGDTNQPATPESDNNLNPRVSRTRRSQESRLHPDTKHGALSAMEKLTDKELTDLLAGRQIEEPGAHQQAPGEQTTGDAQLGDRRAARGLLAAAADAEAAIAVAEAELEQKVAAIVQARRRRAERGVPLVDRPHRLQAPERLTGRGE